MIVLLAASPIGLAIVLLAVLRWPAARAMPACALVCVLLSAFVWRVGPSEIGAALVEATFITISILLILFGAVWLMEQLTLAGALETLRSWLSAQTPDQLLQALLIAWGVGSFFEGAAGFGAPAVITAPLLVALGFKPLAAVVAALIGDSVAVSFGAVGTPLLVGMADGLTSASAPTPQAIAQRLVLYDLIVGPVMPVLLLWTVGLGFKGRSAWNGCLRATPFALCLGIVHLAVTATSVYLVGLEVPSLLGPLAALAVGLFLLKARRLVPSEPFRFQPATGCENPEVLPAPSLPQVLRATAPYALLVLILIVTRLPSLGLRPFLLGVTVSYPNLFGSNISASLQPLYSPFAAFALVTLAAPLWFRLPHRQLRQSAAIALKRVATALLPLLAAVATVRVFIHSSDGGAGLPSMPVVLASWLSEALGTMWPLFAPWLGALGSFISGSATFSNLLFADIQHSVATAKEWSSGSVLALQSMGAAAGNMVCVHNVVAAAAAVGLVGQESAVLRRTALPMAIYLLLSGIVVTALLAG